MHRTMWFLTAAAICSQALALSAPQLRAPSCALGRPPASCVGGPRNQVGSRPLAMSMMSLSVANSVATRSAGNIFNDNLLARRSNLQKDRLVKIREVFRQIDHDESGSLDVDEMRAALGTMGIGKSREQVKELITEIDHDGNGRVDEEEFIDLVLNLEKKKKVEDVLQSNSASYTIMWKNKGNVYTAVGHYTAEARRRALRRVRGDDKSFASESAKLSIPVNALSPIAKAVKTGEEVVINAGAGGFLEKMHSPERRSLAKEFGIRHVHFVPVNGGVMEYGRPAGEEVECIKLLNLLVVDTLHPSSPKALFKSVLEILAVLLLIVKLERNDVVNDRTAMHRHPCRSLLFASNLLPFVILGFCV